LLSQLRDADGAERVGATAGQGSKADHEEVQTREGHHVDGNLAEVRVQLAGESKTGRNTGHNCRDQVVEVAIGGVRQFEGAHADVVESLVVDAEGLVRVLDELVDREGGVVRLDDGVRYFGGR